MSCCSLQNLFIDLKEKYDISYLLTHRLNQDCLENFFSQLRTRGGLHDHPSPLNAIYRIRMILLGKNPGIVQAHANVQSLPGMEEEQYLVAKAFQEAKIGEIHVMEPGSPHEDISDVASSVSSSSAASAVSVTNVAENDGLLYLAGYLAKKHKQEFPDLGTKTSEEAFIDHSYCTPSWIHSLSYGGLTQPSEQWMSNIRQMEKRFRKLHEDSYKGGPKIVHRTAEYIHKKIHLPRKLINSFSRQRIFMRIKYLNSQKEKKLRKRKSGVNNKSRKLAKKMKKTIT